MGLKSEGQLSSHLISWWQRKALAKVGPSRFPLGPTSCQPFDLRILESTYIHKIKPSLNDHASSVELAILK